MRKTVAVFADTHAGHRLGLMNPAVQLLDEDEHGQARPYTPTLSPVQCWLWPLYQDHLCNAWTISDGAPLVAVHAGDVCWGSKHPDGVVSTRAADQIAIAVANMQPWLEMPNLTAMRFLLGTEAHEYGEGTASIAVASALSKMAPRCDIAAVSHSLMDFDGVLCDISHHGPTSGSKIWLSGNALRGYVTDIMLSEIVRGAQPPQVVVRAHNQVPIHETVRVGGHTCEAFVLPCYCGMNHFARQATRSAYTLGCGMLVLEIEDGELRRTHEFTRWEDLRRKERL
jgi:hypothetical protein